MRMIMGLDLPDSGSTTVNGVPYEDLRWPLREVGALLDAKAFHPGRRARNHLKWLAQTNDIPAARIDEVLDLVGLTAVADKRAGKFSLGMGQRLGIAGALLGDPGVLLFDEPVNGLDPEGIRWVRHLLRDLARQGRTVLVSSHLITEMSLTAERLVVIGRGTPDRGDERRRVHGQNAAESVRIVTPDPAAIRQRAATAPAPDRPSTTAPSSSAGCPRRPSASWPPPNLSPCTSSPPCGPLSRTPSWSSPATPSSTAAPSRHP